MKTKRKQQQMVDRCINDNYNWFISKADLGDYEGQWIAIENKKIVANNPRLEKILPIVNDKFPHAAVTKVPKRGQIMVL